MNCGVKLADTEAYCPLCKTEAFHPDIRRPQGERLYPPGKHPAAAGHRLAPAITASAAFLLPLLIVLLCDLEINHAVTWSGFVMGALLTGYVLLVLPAWFPAPNPVIFTPCGFAAAGLYLLYINLATSGRWFLSFAFPVVGGLCLIFTAMVTLLRYVRGGKLYIWGGTFVALGLFMPLMELLLNVTFHRPHFAAWSLYPMTALVLLGGFLIFLAICRPARAAMERVFFF